MFFLLLYIYIYILLLLSINFFVVVVVKKQLIKKKIDVSDFPPSRSSNRFL